MNEEQIERIREIVQEYAEKSGTDFDAAFKRVLGITRYHAIDVIPWGKTAACVSGKGLMPGVIERTTPQLDIEK